MSALVLTGCATSSQSGSEYSADDIAFAEMMIPHHEQAIEMSEIALLNTTNPEVLQLAQEIKDAQSPEIELMKSWAGEIIVAATSAFVFIKFKAFWLQQMASFQTFLLMGLPQLFYLALELEPSFRRPYIWRHG